MELHFTPSCFNPDPNLEIVRRRKNHDDLRSRHVIDQDHAPGIDIDQDRGPEIDVVREDLHRRGRLLRHGIKSPNVARDLEIEAMTKVNVEIQVNLCYAGVNQILFWGRQ